MALEQVLQNITTNTVVSEVVAAGNYNLVAQGVFDSATIVVRINQFDDYKTTIFEFDSPAVRFFNFHDTTIEVVVSGLPTGGAPSDANISLGFFPAG